jgi:hypothetical protein
MDKTPTDLFCPECGRALQGRRNFCPYCGHSFREEEPGEPRHPDQQPAVQGPREAAPAAQPVKASQQAPVEPAAFPEQSSRSPSPRAQARVPSQRGTPPSTARAGTRQRRGFRLADRRVLFGLLGMVDLPLIVILVALLILPRISPGQPSLCEQLDTEDFVPSRFETGLGGELTENTLLSADTEYLIQDTLIVPKDRELFIQSGVRLVFDKDAALEVHGKLYACGTERKPLTFTSDEGEAGSWTGIRLHGAGEDSIISNALIQFAGDRALYLDRSTPTLSDVEIANSSAFPVSIGGNRIPTFSGRVELDDNPFQAIEIRSGSLEEETITWPNNGFVYVVSGPLEVGVNTTLTVEPGVTVKFYQTPNGRSPGIGVRGLLKAEQVQFTSVYDSRDAVGGVTYQQAQDPEPGDWAGIGFYEGSNKSYLRNSTIQYAGQGQYGAVYVQRCSPELTDVTIADTAWYPLSVGADSFPSLNDLTLEGNNPGDALEVRDGSSVTGRNERTWDVLPGEPQIVRVVRGDVTVEPEAVLTIEPGVVIKFEEKGRLVVKGTLHAVGQDSEQGRIVFTSLRDGDYAGDTDKTTGPQDTRSWRGLAFDGADENSVLQQAVVRYGPVVLQDASPQLIDNVIRDSETAAIYASPSSSPELQGNRLENNGANGIAVLRGGIQTDQTWTPMDAQDQQIPRVLVGEVTVKNGATLSIGPGTVIKANSDGRLRLQGGLQVLGEANNPVVFTSFNDDTAAGDTNQRLQEPLAGDWPGIEVGADARVTIRHAVIRYAERGLSLRGGSVPTVEGWLRILDGREGIWCREDVRLPSALDLEDNEIDVQGCASD